MISIFTRFFCGKSRLTSAATCIAIGLLSSPSHANGLDTAVMSYESNATEHVPQISNDGCTINIVSLMDQRTNKETIGNELRSILSGDPIPWMSAGLDNLSAYGFKVKRNEVPQVGMINMHLQLTRAYTWHNSMRINSATTFSLGITDINGIQTVEKIRAFGSKSNWAGGTAEYVTAINFAFNSALDKIANSLKKKCVKS